MTGVPLPTRRLPASKELTEASEAGGGVQAVGGQGPGGKAPRGGAPTQGCPLPATPARLVAGTRG